MLRVYFFMVVCFVFASSSPIELSLEQKEYLKQKKVITMCVDPDWAPFEIINQKGEHEGIAGDLIRLVAKRLGIDIVLVPTTTWQETLEFSKEYKCDILSFLNETPKRKEWLTFTNPIFTDPNVLVGRAENSYIEDLSKISASIALPQGTAMSELFAKDFPNLTIIPTITEEEAFELVENKKADLTLRSMIVAAYTIKKEGHFNLKIIGQPSGYENYLRIGVRKDEPILKDILNQGIATITKEDTQSIINKHVTIIIEKVTNITIGAWIVLILTLFISLILLWNYLLRKKVADVVNKNLEQQEIMFQQNKQAELGSLIGNISHQWRDGLSQISAINLNLRAMLEFGVDITKDDMNKSTKEIEKSITFMTDTIKVFLDFYKPAKESTEFYIQDSLKEVLSIIDMKIKCNQVSVIIEEHYPLQVVAKKMSGCMFG